MTFKERFELTNLQKFDSIFGKVTANTSKGIWIDIGEGICGFASYSTLPIGTTLLCSIRRLDLEKEFVLLDIDSTISVAA